MKPATTTTGLRYPVHIRHDSDGEGHICYEISGESSEHLMRRGVERCIREGFDVHSASECQQVGKAGMNRSQRLHGGDA